MALAPGADRASAREEGAPAGARGLDAELSARGAVRRERHAAARPGDALPERRAAHERDPADERRRGSPRPGDPRLSRLRGRRAGAGEDVERSHERPRESRARRDRPEHRPVQSVRPRRDRLEPARSGVRGHGSSLGGRDPPLRRPSRHRGPGHGGAVGAPVPGLARGLPADGPPRRLQLLRGLHPHHRLDDEPACQVAQGDARHPLAAPDRVAQLPALVARVASGSQRVLAPGPGLHRPRRQQEGRDRPRLPAAGRQLSLVGRRPLPAQPPLRERGRRRKATHPRLPRDR